MSADGRISRVIEAALAEDIGLGDVTSDATVHEGEYGRGDFLCKAQGTIAGLEVAAHCFELCDDSLVTTLHMSDGSTVRAGHIPATVEGRVKGILRGERTALNIMQRMSGIATLTRAFCEAVAGTRAKITDTRKTAPGIRVLDKWAVRLGGGVNHRFGLDDMVLIKDNHIVAAGSITEAVDRCRKYLARHDLKISVEVETKDLSEVEEALRCAGIQRIMLDNFPLEDMRRAVALINHRVEVEASGGVSLETVRPIAETGVDLISVGALTHSVKGLDISLELSHVR